MPIRSPYEYQFDKFCTVLGKKVLFGHKFSILLYWHLEFVISLSQNVFFDRKCILNLFFGLIPNMSARHYIDPWSAISRSSSYTSLPLYLQFWDSAINDLILFLKRSPNGHFPRMWAWIQSYIYHSVCAMLTTYSGVHSWTWHG